MAFFGYDPYDYHYTSSPYHHPYPYYSRHQQPAPARRAGGFFPGIGDTDQYYFYQPEPAISRSTGGFFPISGGVDPFYHHAPSRRAGRVVPVARNIKAPAGKEATHPNAGASKSVSVPVCCVESQPEVEISRKLVKRAPSAEEAAVRIQAAARALLARKAVRALRSVEREAEEIGEKVACEAETLRGDGRARIAVGEQLMKLLFRLDAVRGAREYRRKVTKRVLALQDAVDALEQRPAAVAEDEAAETSAVETVEENAMGAGKLGAETVAAEMEVDGNTAAVEETEPAAPDGANLGADEPADEDAAEGKWEMVTDEPVAARQSSAEEAGEDMATRPALADGGGADAKKLMAMVATLCEQSAQQCAVVGALAERVDALERAVRRVEDAERRRRRGKKLRKEGKGSNHARCYSD
ncbi:hypothetical protein PR202_ga21946 [Eleusine coracana subsp. coracana]|uniref:BAG domain-containing protein n=1 Tax=Eleusine coracana subsp. coracana TaxID=191504 RepID=A0AAV5D2A5_ELECO|nr:hypothetical protein QOZ80_9AG0682670 [Eleusine coracana subsp. coracana]GJN04399.1 hypothetical protein PR202_ga21946 [Eleusine coracana subsp. coracana]